jgi:hypothetical protein
MKTFVSWILIFAILISTFPRAAFATEPPPWFEGPDPNETGPVTLLADPVMSAMQETQTANKLGVLSAVIPFTDEAGRWFDFKIDFTTRAYQILDSSGQVVGGGLATQDHARALESAIKQYRAATAAQGEMTSAEQQKSVLGVIAIIVAVIAVIIAYLAWQDANSSSNATGQQLDQMCAGQAANATATNFANTSATCPMRVTRRGSQMCTTFPSQVTQAGQCTGATYMCVTKCE